MDNRESQAQGLALLCDRHGVIRQVISNTLYLEDHVLRNRPLPLIVDPGSRLKAQSFLSEIQEHDAAFDWELNVLIQDSPTLLHFAGSVLDHGLLVLGARTSADMLNLWDELMQIQNEQANSLRAAIKQQTQLTQQHTERDSHFYNELTRLNNELGTLQRELARKNVELERLDELKNQFLGMAAHDLRNPLGIIMAYSEFLMMETEDQMSAQHRQFLSIIKSSSEFMLGLVNNLLDVAAIESGQLQISPQMTDLNALVAGNVSLNSMLAERKGITLTFRGQEDLPPIPADAPRIEQLLNNLISNAIKYSYPDTAVHVSITPGEDRAVIAVQDEGQGIPPQDRDRLFQFFGRTSVRSTGGERSTGLGLAIAQKIVQGHGGEIWVESEVGKGSTFYVALPLRLTDGPRLARSTGRDQ
ncbi:MAG: HAMP domain-containing histidine kinase [Chloroflexi bacterium]|nr:HAMP domain-containing histidine kinase [Chloroflexota bacterium]